MFPLDDFFEVSAFAFLWLLFFLLRIFYSDLRCEHLLVCHPNSSQNAWCGWLQLPDSIHFNTLCSKPFPTGFPSETISLQLSKTLFPCNSVISLNYESLQYIYIYIIYIYIHIYIYIRINICMYIYIYEYIYTYFQFKYFITHISSYFLIPGMIATIATQAPQADAVAEAMAALKSEVHDMDLDKNI